MEELWREVQTPENGREVVLTYRQAEQIEPVTLRYERPMPAYMEPGEAARAEATGVAAFRALGSN